MAAKMIRVEGFVYCHVHGDIHGDTTDPYGYGKPDCTRAEHRLVYFRARSRDVESADRGEKYVTDDHYLRV